VQIALARVWRLLLVRTTFIAVTGSIGKTTTKDCAAAVLGTRFRTVKSHRNQNDWRGVPRTILRARPWHRVAVVEIGSDRPGRIRQLARLARPHIGIVLGIERVHANAFPTLEASAAEKAALLAALPRTGLAILNADDPHVRAMAGGCPCPVRTFGLSPGADVRGDEISGAWPARLSLTVHAATESARVHTKLVGTHWASAVLAAISAGLASGVDLAAAAGALERVEPFAARMQPVPLPSGATLIRDDAGNARATLDAALAVLARADAARRVLVVGEYSDTPQRTQVRFRELGRAAARAADIAIFVGPHHARLAVTAAVAAGMRPGSALAFRDLPAVAEHLRSVLGPGDLVLLKGRATDHLARVFFAQLGPVACRRRTCRKTSLCDVCEELRPAGTGA
jgi:UDP-N-acetylmuramoyl-tripeptide--D-alanyl-D-alanine ligase